MKISIEKAKQNKLFYFVVTGTIYNPNLKKCLILQRSKREIAHPGLWGVTGGKLEWADLENNPVSRMNHGIPNWEGLVEKLLFREAKEESGLVTEDPRYLGSVVFVRPDNVPVVCFQFALKTSQEAVTIPQEFDDYAWVDAEEVKQYHTIQGIDKEVSNTIAFYQKSKIY
jgi:8-oxo-dGTP pyrophosphatase MutT (NUDIX family)